MRLQEPALHLRRHFQRRDDGAGPVIGYVSHGTNAGMPSNYISSQLQFTLGPGAVFETHESFNAYSFQQGGNTMGQGQVAQWLAAGGTVGVGNVQEPEAGTNYEPNEDKIFAMLLDGKTWAEAAWTPCGNSPTSTRSSATR